MLLHDKTDYTPSTMNRESETIRFGIYDSALGPVLVAATDCGVCAILFGTDAVALEQDLRARFPDAALTLGDTDFSALAEEVLQFVADPRRDIGFPLDPRGTDFQRRVWTALRGIAPGTTESYKDVATRLGSPRAVRAVARACAANPLAVAVPCHRVVRSDGSLSGYRWGIARKRALLEKEARA